MSVTLKDVAKVAGVNFTLVSKLINNPDVRIRPETRERILKAIRDLNYHPSRSARALRLGRSDLLGLVSGDLTNAYFAHYADAALEEAESHGCRLVISVCKNGDPGKAVRDLMNEQVRGILSCFPADGTEECPILTETPFTRETMEGALVRAADAMYRCGCRTSAVIATSAAWAEVLPDSEFRRRLPGTCEPVQPPGEERVLQLRNICRRRPDVILAPGWMTAETLCNLLDDAFPDYRPAVLLGANIRGPVFRRRHFAGAFVSSTRAAIAAALAQLLGDPAGPVPPGTFALRGTPEYDQLISDRFQLT